MKILKSMSLFFCMAPMLLCAIDKKNPPQLSIAEERWLASQAKMLDNQKNDQDALKLYEKLLMTAPKNPEYLFRAGQLYARQGQLDQANRYLQQALIINAEDEDIRLALAYLNLRMNHLNESEELFETVLENAPFYADAWVGLGRVDFLKGHYELAEKSFNKALELNPNNDSAIQFLNQLKNVMASRGNPDLVQQAQFLEKQGDKEGAINIYRELTKQFPLNGGYFFKLGKLYGQVHRNPESFQSYLKAAHLQPNNLDIQLALAYSYLFNNELEESEKLFSRILNSQPDYGDALVGLGRIYALKGQNEEAKELYNKALKIDPTNKTVHIYLKQLDEQQSNINDSRSDQSLEN